MIRHWLHEWRMRRRIRAILRYNRKHPEECINLREMWESCESAEPRKPLTQADIERILEPYKLKEV